MTPPCPVRVRFKVDIEVDLLRFDCSDVDRSILRVPHAGVGGPDPRRAEGSS